jgi:uncharacterized protein (DUF488 family)
VAGIECVADVRRFPGSRRMPHFNSGALERELGDIGYVHLEELGGRRNPVPGSPNGGWRVKQFQGYADHMESEEFARGLERLEAAARDRRTAVMCAEAQWTSCHRRLLSDALLVRGWRVLHIRSDGRQEEHVLTGFAEQRGGRLVYPSGQTELGV